MRPILRPLFLATALSCGAIASGVMAPEAAFCQSIKLETQASEIHVGMPFILSVVVADFDETPQPEIEEFKIENAKVVLTNVSPRTSSMVTIINGRRTEKKDVTFVFNYQVTPLKEGIYTIPSIRAFQSGRETTSRPMTFTAASVPTTVDMKLELVLPDRNLWVGETFEATLVWYLRKGISKHDFSVPILEMPEYFEVEEPDGVVRGQNVVLSVGSRYLSFPYTRDNVMLGGLEYTRFSIPLHLTPLQSGVITIPASIVMAELESGQKQQDFWGFERAAYTLFKAEDRDRTCTVQSIPTAARPASYVNAMGSDFAIQVSADRTIVKAGDPIELTVEISSPSSLEGLRLPALNVSGLNDQLFAIPSDEPIGENIDGGKERNIKRFKIPIRVKSERVTEIPPIAFSYFNPKTEEFTTVRSQPIALSVTSVEKVSAEDVISVHRELPKAEVKPSAGSSEEAREPIDPTAGSLELSLRSTPESLKPTAGTWNTRPVRIAIYGLPFLAWFGLLGIRRVRRKQRADEPQRDATSMLKKALQSAETLEARDAAAGITNALNTFLTSTQTPRAPFQEICEKLDAEAYRPNASKLPTNLVDELKQTVKKHVNPAYAKIVSSILTFIFAVALCFDSGTATAQEMSDEALLTQAQTTYHQAISSQTRADRIAGFKRASSLFGQLVERHPDNSALQVDYGNASLGAVDFGRAALAYQRALALDPSIEQAQNNLAYIQSIQGEPVSSDRLMISTAFFLNDVYSRDMRLLMAAILFALCGLMIVPWHEKSRRILRYLSVFPFVLWIWMIAGVCVEPEKNEAVVMHESYLKTADNVGASNIVATPLEPGYSVEVVKTVGDWKQVKTPSGVRGWLPNSNIECVKPEK